MTRAPRDTLRAADELPSTGQPGTAPDLLQRLIALLAAHLPQVTDEQLCRIERTAREQLGGQRVHIAKRRPHLNPTERQALQADVLGTSTDTELMQRYRISRATLYRHLKR